MVIKHLHELYDNACNRGPVNIAVAQADDENLLRALDRARSAGFVNPVLTGNKDKIEEAAANSGFDLNNIIIAETDTPEAACVSCINMIKNGSAEIIVKGNVKTATLLRKIIDKDKGIPNKQLISHLAIFESPFYHKLLCVTDAALNISPDVNEKAAIIHNAVELFHKIGVSNPKVAVITALEYVNPKIEATLHAEILKQMNHDNLIKACIVDGPFALDNAVSKKSAIHKNIDSEVAGDADILLVPDLNSGNILYKCLNFLGGAISASVILGAKVPVVLTSRSDSEQSKLYSLALAVNLS